MSRDTDLEIRLRMAAMAPASTYVSVQREELLADLFELLELRSQRSRRPDPVARALRRHPSTSGSADAAVRPLPEDERRGPVGIPRTEASARETRRRWP